MSNFFTKSAVILILSAAGATAQVVDLSAPSPGRSNEIEIADFKKPGANGPNSTPSKPQIQPASTPLPVATPQTKAGTGPSRTVSASPSDQKSDTQSEVRDTSLAIIDTIDFDEEYSLTEGGNFVPASKLFTELLSEKAAAAKAREAALLAKQEAETETSTAADGSQIIGYKKVTKTVTRTIGGSGGFVSSHPGLDVNFKASREAMSLVRLASMGDGNPLPAQWAQYMIDAGRKYNIDPVLILEVARQESRFKNTARSGANAHGLMQFIPATASRFGIDPYNPQQAIHGGARYLRFLLNMFGGEVRSALAGYNAGEGAVMAFSTGRTLFGKTKKINPLGRVTRFGIPPYAETQHYVATIYQKYLTSLDRLRRL